MLYTEILGLLLQSWARDSNNVTESKGQEKIRNLFIPWCLDGVAKQIQ